MRGEISVVIAVRNAELTLEQAVRACLEDAVGEILLVINGCSDGTEEVAKGQRSKDDRVRILESSAEGGVVEALRVGCAAARGQWIGRMDADDWSEPGRFQKQLDFAKTSGVEVVSSQIVLEGALGEGMQRYVDWVNGLVEHEDFLRERFIESPVVQPGVLMNRDTYERVGGYCDPSEFGGPEDYELWLRMLEAGVKFRKCKEAVLHWQDSESRLTRTHARYERKAMVRAKALYLAKLEQVKKGGVVIAGAGPQGKMLARLLLAEGVRVLAFLEVDEKKFGRYIHEIQVLSHEHAVEFREAVMLGAVGVNGGREKTTTLAEEAGFRSGIDYFGCC